MASLSLVIKTGGLGLFFEPGGLPLGFLGSSDGEDKSPVDFLDLGEVVEPLLPPPPESVRTLRGLRSEEEESEV